MCTHDLAVASLSHYHHIGTSETICPNEDCGHRSFANMTVNSSELHLPQRGNSHSLKLRPGNPTEGSACIDPDFGLVDPSGIRRIPNP
jgi:hypothetical protein